VGTEVPAQPATARKGEALKAKKEAPKPTVSVDELVRRGQLKQAGSRWGTYADTGEQGKWEDLTATQQEAWRVAVFSERGPSIADTLEIAPAKRGAPPSPKGEAAVAAAPVAAPVKPKEQLAAKTDEEAWNSAAPSGEVRYASLPKAAKKAWAESGKTTQDAAFIVGAVTGSLEPDVTFVELLEFAVGGVDASIEAGNLKSLMPYAWTLADIAFMTDESTGNKPLVVAARQYLEDTAFTAQQQEVIDFVNSYNASNGRGGQSEAARKFNISILTVSTWLKKSGNKVAKVANAKATPAGKSSAKVSSALTAKVASLIQMSDRIQKAEAEIAKLRAGYESLKASIKAAI
jgi:hypothetical protein